MKKRRRALVLQPRIRIFGGAEGVAAWMMEALAPDHQLVLVCSERPDLAAIDRRYGTTLQRAAVDVVQVPTDIGYPRLRMDCLRDWALQRVARKLARDVDLAVCADNEADLGERALQYVHFPKYVFRRRGARDIGWYHATHWPGACYLAASARLTGFRVARMRRNRTLVCSQWVGEHVRRVHGIDAITLYPPAAGDFPPRSWNERHDGFVWAGRLWPDKRVELAIEIVERVRAYGFGATLRLLGAAHDPAYAEHIRSLVRARASWLRLDEDVDRAQLAQVMATYRYGLHATPEEAFGMAPAELVRAGAIVFVPDGGGQKEVVDRDARLVFGNADDAVEKIVNVMRSSELQRVLRMQLAARAEHFSSERFVRDFRVLCGLPAVPDGLQNASRN